MNECRRDPDRDRNRDRNKVVTDETSLRKFFEGTHGLTKVRLEAFPSHASLYRETLGIGFRDGRQRLDAAVAIRHDIIHRNGKTTAGVAHKLGAQEVYEVIRGAGELVETVEREYNARFPHIYDALNGEPDF